MERAVYRRMAEHEERHWWFHGRRQIVGALLRRYLPPRDRPVLLEVGCGTGGNLELLRRFGSVDAVEYDAEARDIAARKSGLAVGCCALPDEIDAPDGRYDLVLLLDVLEHVEQDVAALATLRRKLHPYGRLLVTVPALPWLWSAHDDRHGHFRRYTKSTLRKAAEAAGLKVVALGYFSTLLLPLIAAARLAKKVFGGGPDDVMPNDVVNGFLRAVFALERRLIGRVPMPIGSSLYLVAE